MTAPRCYLLPEESLLYATRRHAVMLASSVVVFAVAMAGAIALWVEAPHRPADNLREISLALAAAGFLYFVWNTWHWWLGRYVITTQRIIHVEGLVARHVKSLPLRLILDTTYHRTLAGRLFGYCDLELNLSGQPGLRRLTRVPDGDTVYHLILQLLNAHAGKPAPAPAKETTAEEDFPKNARRQRAGSGPVRSSRSQ